MNEIYQKLLEQLACEFNCKPQDFSLDREADNIVTLSVLNEGRRHFSDKPFFLQMASLGGNTVISADPKMHAWLNEWVKGKNGIWLFEQHNFFDLECELRKHGYKMSLTHHMFLPKMPSKLEQVPEPVEIKPDFEIRWLEQADIMKFYGDERFPNAICDKFKPERPDVLAVVAVDNDRIMGMAGCSADTPLFWQIGIDVLPEYRGRGVAKTLVSLLKNEAFRRGAIPYYGTSLSNLGSWKTALASGFEPAWIETEARECEDKKFEK